MGSPSWPQMTRRISALWTARCLQPLRTSLETLSTATVASSSNWTAHKRGFTTSSCGGDCSTSAQCSCCRLYPHLWEHTGISSHCQGPEGSAHLSSANIRPTGQLHCTALNAISTVAVPQPQPHRCHQNAMLRQPSTAVNWAQIGAFGASLQLHTANSSGHTSLAQHCSSATVSHLRMLVPAARQCSCPAKQQQWGRCLHSSSAVTQKSDKPKSPNSSSASTGSSEGREEEYEGLQVYLDGDDNELSEFEAKIGEGEEGEEFDSEWVDGSVINTYHDPDVESDLEYDVEFDEAWEDEEEVDDLQDPDQVKSG